MIKSELIEKIAVTNPHLMQKDVEKIVNVIFEEITGALARGDRVELRGFGAFSVKHRPARTGRNPRTGDQVQVAEKYVPYFKTGKELRMRLNPAPASVAPSPAATKSAAAKPAAAKPAAAKPAAPKAAPRRKAAVAK